MKCFTCLFELDEEMWQKRVHQWKPIEELEKMVGDCVGDCFLLIEHHSEDPFVGHWDGKEWVESKHYEPMNPTHYAPLPERLEEPK